MNCRQVKILRMDVENLAGEDLAILEPPENMPDITLRYRTGPSFDDVFFELRRWRQLRQLTLNWTDYRASLPSFGELKKFILRMENLTNFQILIPHHRCNFEEQEGLRKQVNQLNLPKLSFDISGEN